MVCELVFAEQSLIGYKFMIKPTVGMRVKIIKSVHKADSHRNYAHMVTGAVVILTAQEVKDSMHESDIYPGQWCLNNDCSIKWQPAPKITIII